MYYVYNTVSDYQFIQQHNSRIVTEHTLWSYTEYKSKPSLSLKGGE